ncbi:MFS transporter [Cobetia sp. L2A1]|uniref:MFS transporter n=1 Tax=Cobetia sp. L2A1 TaxID=2686360 RepID=UPI00131BEFA5|nr:MFS transporter [Cobetia sp. L2A1]
MPASHVARHPRMAELALALGAFAIGTTEFVIMGLMPNIADAFSVSSQQVGYAISAYAMGVVVGAPLISALGARLPRRGLLIGLMLLFAVSNVASLLAPSLASFAALRFIAGLPHGVYLGVAALVAADAAPAGERGRAVGRVMMGLTVAILAGAPVATWIGSLFGWHAAFIVVGMLALITAALVRSFVPYQPGNRHATPLTELAALIKPRVLFTLGIACIGFGGMFSVYSYAVPTLNAQADLAPSLVPMVLAVFGVGTILGNLVGSRAADIDLMRTIPALLIWSALVQGGFYFAADGVWSGLLFVGLVGTGIGLAPALQMRLMDVAEDAQTMAATLNHAAFNIANALGAWCGGLAFAYGPSHSSIGLVGVAMAIAGLIVFLLGQRYERRQMNTASA